MASPTPNKNAGKVRDIITGPHRLTFLHLTAPNSGGQYRTNKYEATVLIAKDNAEAVKILRDAAMKAAREIWPGIEMKDVSIGVRDGDEKAHLEGYPGHWFINPRSKNAVPTYGPAREVIGAADIRAGDWCRVCLTAGAYRKNLDPELARDLAAAGRKVFKEAGEGGKVSYYRPAVTFYLNAVQYVRRGEPFGGGKANPELFPVDEAGGQEGGGFGEPAPPGNFG